MILDIAEGYSSASKKWHNKKYDWEDFAEKLRTPLVKDVTYAKFRKLTKTDAAAIKDVGGYVGGYLNKGSRKDGNVAHRQLLTLDVDFARDDFWDAFTFAYDCEAVMHSSISHGPGYPRFRLLIPMSRECAPDEYSAVSRRVAYNIGIEFFDNTTFDVNRLMYWPSKTKDGEFIYERQLGEFIDVDEILATYKDWRDVAEWPTNKEAKETIKQQASRQADPLEKRGTVGAFCRAFTIQGAIEKFLGDKYTDGTEGRFTYLHGSTANGLVVYEDKFAFSHHSTDPCSGQLCNAFDLVRVHKFGELDNAPNSLKSFKAMEEFAVRDPEVKAIIAREIKEVYASEFEDTEGHQGDGGEELDDSWLADMDMDPKGKFYLNTEKNFELVIKNDPGLKDRFAMNLFNQRPYLRKSPPWRRIRSEEPIKNIDLSGLRVYIGKNYGISGKDKVSDAFTMECDRNAWHPVREYLDSLEWDKTPRIDSLAIDYFGVEDNAFTRASIRITLMGAVARVMQPGIQFDLVPVLAGEEGIYKSTFWRVLGRQWFSDTLTDMSGKEGLEQLQGAWIVELAELASMRKSDAETAKHFISKPVDSFRPAYGHVKEDYPRQNIFVASTNHENFLRDSTGNRRFMPLLCRPDKATKDVKLDLIGGEIDQIWAEATFRYLVNREPIYLKGEEERIAKTAQSDHFEKDDRAGMIEEFLEMSLPEEWADWNLEERQFWMGEDSPKEKPVYKRTEVCTVEVWCECLGKQKEDLTRFASREISDIIKSLGWKGGTTVKKVSSYGKQRVFTKKN